MRIRRLWFRSLLVGTVGFLMVGGVGYYLNAQNVFRRSIPVVEILPPPPEEPVVELLPAPDDGPVEFAADALEPLPELEGTPLVEIEAEPAEPPVVDLAPFLRSRGDTPLELTAIVPNRVQSGSGATFHLRMTNTGERTLHGTEIDCRFGGSLAFPGSATPHIKRSLSSLKPGDAREVQLTLWGTEPGWGFCRFTFAADGIEPREQQYQIAVIPRLWDLSLVGPGSRAAGQRSEFMLRLSNRTAGDLRGLQIGMTSDAILKPTNFGEGLKKDGPDYIWRPDDLAPGQTLMLPFEFLCADPTEQACVSVWVSGDNIPQDKIDACLTITPPDDRIGVDFGDGRDPIRRGDNVVYEGIIENRSLQPLRGVKLALESTSPVTLIAVETEWIPAYLMLPQPEWRIDAHRITSGELAEFPTNARLKFTVAARAADVGDAELRLTVSAQELSSPLTFTEYTSVATPLP